MPTYARCPECHAALPPGASWCSLCHHDLRAPATGALASTTPGSGAELVSVTAGGGRHAVPEGEPGPAAPLPPVRGRHRRPEPEDTPTEGAADPAGSHRVASDPVRLRADVDALVADAPRDAEGKPDVEVLTAQLMARLASSEGGRGGSGLPDLDSVPGGKWGVMVGGMVAMAVVLVIVFGVLGALVLR